MNLKRGSKGDEVSALQTALNSAGYSLDVDGSYGPKTEAAVRDYQTKNNLTIDGITGDQTWGALTSQTNPTQASPQTSQSTTVSSAVTYKDPDRPTFAKSDALVNAENALAEYQKNKPGEYQSPYTAQIQGLLDQVLNGKQFEYDFNADPIYQQYRDQYIKGGQQAMDDTTARMAALSGGYANSYAATAGNQAYQSYLDKLNNIIPELEQNAYNRYLNDRNEQYNQLSTLQNMDASDYGRYRDDVSDWYNQYGLLYDDANRLYGQDWEAYALALDQYNTDRTFAYNKYMDDLALAQAALAGSGGSGGGSRSGSGSSKKTEDTSDNTTKSDYNLAKTSWYLKSEGNTAKNVNDIKTAINSDTTLTKEEKQKAKAEVDFASKVQKTQKFWGK